MTAKQAIFDELGDLFSNMPVANDEKEKPSEQSQEDDILVSEDIEFEPVEEAEEEISDTQADNSDDSQDESDDDIFSKPMSYEEIHANIQAASQAMLYDEMSPEAINWGQNFIHKMGEKLLAKIRADVDNIDYEALAAQIEQDFAESEAKEQEEVEQMLR